MYMHIKEYVHDVGRAYTLYVLSIVHTLHFICSYGKSQEVTLINIIIIVVTSCDIINMQT